MTKILISSCIVGLPVRFDGRCLTIEELKKLVDEGKAIAFCPEVSAGLPIPRKPSEVEPGKTAADVLDGKAKVITIDGEDITEAFLKGAYNTLNICKENDVTVAILRENSPSCGSTNVYNGTFTGVKVPGVGLTTELLKRNGITVYSHENYPKELIEESLNS